jgi:NADPH:quinone reductase-like Zn-dependent oxidoreductase
MKEKTVLIHSACGGVGLAAIQVCQAVGAEVNSHFSIQC